jgi:hypothetical protein
MNINKIVQQVYCLKELNEYCIGYNDQIFSIEVDLLQITNSDKPMELIIVTDIKSKILELYQTLKEAATNSYIDIKEMRYLPLYIEFKKSDKLQMINNIFNSNHFHIEHQSNVPSCEACGETLMLSESAETICKCGAISKLTIESEFYNSGGVVKPKIKNYNPSSHCINWIQQIQAKEYKEIPSDLINNLYMKCLEFAKKNDIRKLKCSNVRFWLKELQQTTKYNKHAALIVKILSSKFDIPPIIPPQLTDEEQRTLALNVSIDIDIYNKITKDPVVVQKIGADAVKKKVYYPYFIYKNLLIMLKGDHRLADLIDCIHLRKHETIVKYDSIYLEISKKRERKSC